MFKAIKNSLTLKIILSVSIVLLITIIITSVVLASIIRNDLITVQKEKGKNYAQSAAKSIETVLEMALETEQLTKDELFDYNYKPINDPSNPLYVKDGIPISDTKAINEPPNYNDYKDNPLKYTTDYVEYTDEYVRPIEDEFQEDSDVTFVVLVDKYGFLPTHNTNYSKPLTGESVYDQKNNRTRRFFKDKGAGMVAAQNTNTDEPTIVIYDRQEGNKTVKMWDISYPVFIQGDHWGAVRIGFSTKNTFAKANKIIIYFIIGNGALLIILIVSIFIILRIRLVRHISKITFNIKRVSDGDLHSRTRIINEDEIGKILLNINNMADKLESVLVQVVASVDQLLTSANEINKGNTDLSTRTERQAATLEETASTMEEITSTVKQSTENANTANKIADQAKAIAMEGGEIVEKAVESMKAINMSSKKISDIINVIDDIAFQTNLLALNAAVEAARAGEKGRGFAVVATEVRNLAQRSSSAAQEIAELIQDSTAKVEEGSELVDRSGESLQSIIDNTKQVADYITSIAAASKEQYIGIEEVNRGVIQLDEITQQNASLAEQVNSASENLFNQVQSLRSVVSYFKIRKTFNKNKFLSQNTKKQSKNTQKSGGLSLYKKRQNSGTKGKQIKSNKPSKEETNFDNSKDEFDEF